MLVPGLAFICQEVLELNMAGTFMSAPGKSNIIISNKKTVAFGSRLDGFSCGFLAKGTT